MEKIIIGTDFSTVAYNAVKYGVGMALALNTDVILFHAYQVPVPFPQLPVMNYQEFGEYAESNMRFLKEKVQKEYGQQLTVTSVTRLGPFVGELKHVCEEVKPYMVIIGTHAETGSGRLLLGSGAVDALKHLKWPVIAVPPQSTFGDIRKIGMACDFQQVLNKIPVDEIERLVTVFNAELHILSSGSTDELDPGAVFESGMMKGILKRLNPQYHFIPGDDPDKAILECAEKINADLLIVLPKQHNLIDRIIHHSHTKQFVLHSHIPVMALHL